MCGTKRIVFVVSVLLTAMVGVVVVPAAASATEGAITTVVVAELFVSVSGLGGLLHAAGSTYQMAKMLVPAIILAGLGIAVDALLSKIERASARWYGG